MNEFDYVIVGAGTAGCVLAERLSADGKNTVLVLEAGGSDRNLWIQMPIGYGRTFFDPKVNWMYETEAIPGLGNRKSYWPRGKVVGGSGSINAMVHVRGQPHDFDDWAALGNTGWAWDDVLPYFKKAEAHDSGTSEWHGANGPQHVSNIADKAHPLCRKFIAAAQELGLPYTSDFDGDEKEGVGTYHFNIKHGRRASTANAFLRPALQRGKVDLRTRAQVTKLLFAGKRATGVEYQHRGKLRRASARREVILSGGAINSPQLLMLSGIGDATALRAHGIAPIINAKAVGQNLQDHLAITYFFKSSQPTLNDTLRSMTGKIKAGLHYLFNRGGPFGMSINQGGGFVRSSPDAPRVNLQLYFSPASYAETPVSERRMMNPDPYSAFLLSFNTCRPSSRGYLKLASADPMTHPLIQPNYLSTEHDINEVHAGMKLLHKLARAKPLAEIITQALSPFSELESEDERLADFRDRADTVFHPSCSCVMGPDPKTSVVDARLRVHGIEGLRVVDASIFPTITSGNTNAPTVMVAEKGAVMILEDAR